MSRRFALLALAAVLAIPASARAEEPSAAPRPEAAPVVDLYTFGVGPMLVEKFGHAAICLSYPHEPLQDVCFNYGTTDFEDPGGLIWGFLRGDAKFWVSMTTPASMRKHYRDADRTIWRQRLPLSDAQARLVEEKLLADTLDPEWSYQYNHFLDNCSTRVRDIVDLAVGGAMRAETSAMPGPGLSYRELGRRGFADTDSILLASDIFLGRPSDHVPNLWEAMFLPDYLRGEVERRFGVEPKVLYTRQGEGFPTDAGMGGRYWFLLLALAIGGPLAASRWYGRGRRAAFAWAMTVLGLLGVLLWSVAAITTLDEGRLNEALLVLMPFDLALIFLGERRRRIYARVRLAELLLVSVLLALGVFVQPLWAIIVIPFAAMAAFAFVPLREVAAATVATAAAAAAAAAEPAIEPEAAEIATGSPASG